jgi:hypothetical protein
LKRVGGKDVVDGRLRGHDGWGCRGIN